MEMFDHVTASTLHEQLTRICCVKKALEMDENEMAHLLSCFQDLNDTSISAIFRITNSTTSLLNDIECDTSCDQTPALPYMLYVGFWVIIMISIILSNLLVIVAMRNTTYIKWHVTNLFLSSLAFSDLLIGLFIVPIKIKFAMHSLKFCSLTLCRFYLTSDNILFTVSITNLFLICIDRYLAINYPYLYLKWFTRKRCLLLVFITWIYGIAWGVLVNVKWDNVNQPAIHIHDYQCQINSNYMYATVTLSIVFFIPVIFMGFLYVKILQVAKKQAKGVNRQRQIAKSIPLDPISRLASMNREKELSSLIHDNNNSFLEQSFTSEDISFTNVGSDNLPCKKRPRTRTLKIQTFFLKRSVFKATKTVAIIYGTFVICWLPVSILSLVFSYHREEFTDINFKVFYIILVEILPIINSLLNPFIYAVTNKQYRRAFRKTLCQLHYIGKKQGAAV